LTEQALDFALKKVPSVDPAPSRTKLLDAYWRLDCYPEVPAVLKALKADGARRCDPLERLDRRCWIRAVSSAGWTWCSTTYSRSIR
jgi:FMN phosphatase YigB (HAD superfamily)